MGGGGGGAECVCVGALDTDAEEEEEDEEDVEDGDDGLDQGRDDLAEGADLTQYIYILYIIMSRDDLAEEADLRHTRTHIHKHTFRLPLPPSFPPLLSSSLFLSSREWT